MFCGWCQSFGAWGAIGPHTCWEWRRIVSSLCMDTQLCYQSFQLRSHSIPQRLWFWQSPSGAPWSFFVAAGTCVHSSYWRVGALKVSEWDWKQQKGMAGSHRGDHVFVAWSPQGQQLPVVSGCYFFLFPKIRGVCLLSLLFLEFFFPHFSFCKEKMHF